jgi:hypothetical protein
VCEINETLSELWLQRFRELRLVCLVRITVICEGGRIRRGNLDEVFEAIGYTVAKIRFQHEATVFQWDFSEQPLKTAGPHFYATAQPSGDGCLICVEPTGELLLGPVVFANELR